MLHGLTINTIKFAILKEKHSHTKSSTFNVYMHNLPSVDYMVNFHQWIATFEKCNCALQPCFILYSTKE
jgi:hypothetical protein